MRFRSQLVRNSVFTFLSIRFSGQGSVPEASISVYNRNHKKYRLLAKSTSWHQLVLITDIINEDCLINCQIKSVLSHLTLAIKYGAIVTSPWCLGWSFPSGFLVSTVRVCTARKAISYQSFVIVQYLDRLACRFGMTRFSWWQLMCASSPFPYRL